MATITAPGMLLTGDHASRPAANTVGKGALYACSTHSLIYQSDGSSWSTWANVSGVGLGTWTSYTPALTAASSNPVLGSSTLTGRYKALDAKTYAIVIELNITTGGAWNAGSGVWDFSLPSGLTGGTLRQVVAGHISDSGTRRYPVCGVIAAGGSTVTQLATSDASGNFVVTHNVPITWATGDYLLLTGIIEVA